jgi:hypothetical protein
MCGTKTRQDRIRNDNIRESIGVTPIVEKMVETRLKWFGHVEIRHMNSLVRRVNQMESSQITRCRGTEEDLEKLKEKLQRKILRLISWYI